MSLSMHLLDIAAGCPAAGAAVRLERVGDPPSPVAQAVTDADGRISGLPAAPAGAYRIVVDAGRYFADQGVASFFPEIVITVQIDDPAAHAHVPVLLGPFGYTTYRGS